MNSWMRGRVYACVGACVHESIDIFLHIIYIYICVCVCVRARARVCVFIKLKKSLGFTKSRSCPFHTNM